MVFRMANYSAKTGNRQRTYSTNADVKLEIAIRLDPSYLLDVQCRHIQLFSFSFCFPLTSLCWNFADHVCETLTNVLCEDPTKLEISTKSVIEAIWDSRPNEKLILVGNRLEEDSHPSRSEK